MACASAATLTLALAFMTFQHCLASQNFTLRGPFAIGSVSQRITIAVPGEGNSTVPVELDVILTYPTNGSAPSPVVVLLNGFQARAPWYSSTASHVASWGYVVVQYTVPSYTLLPALLPIVTDRIELGFLQPLLDWVKAQATGGSRGPSPSSPSLFSSPAPASAAGGGLRGFQPDVGRLVTMGHSRGGKLAALHYAYRADVATAVLVDPVDNSGFTPESDSYPSAAKALAATNKTAGVIGAGITGPCNPSSANYNKFFASLAPGSWQMVILQAGHFQFARTGNPFIDWALDRGCGAGRIAAQDVINATNAFAVAWLQSTFRAQPSQTGLAAFQQWVATQTSRRVITFTTKPPAAPPLPRPSSRA